MASVWVAFFSFLAKDLARSLPALFALKMVNLAAEAALLNRLRGVEIKEVLLSRLSFFLWKRKDCLSYVLGEGIWSPIIYNIRFIYSIYFLH